MSAAPECDGLCVMADDVGVYGYPGVVAYPHPGCPEHDPGAACDCGQPDRCMSPTHGQIDQATALIARNGQATS